MYLSDVANYKIKFLITYYSNSLLLGTDAAYGALLLSYCLGDKSAIDCKERTSLYPFIKQIGDDVFDPCKNVIVFAENVDITYCKNIVSALPTCFIVFWIFNISYPKLYNGVLIFLDNFIFHKNSVRISQKISNFINKF